MQMLQAFSVTVFNDLTLTAVIKVFFRKDLLGHGIAKQLQ